MVARKSIIKKKEEKPALDLPKGRKVQGGLKLESLEDAIQDGKWAVPIGGELVILRKVAGKQ